LRKAFKIIKLAIRSLLQHKLRAALSVLGVICGVMAVLAMLSIGEGAKREALSQIEQLGTKNIYLKTILLTEGQQIKASEKLSQGLSLNDANRIRKGCPVLKDIACLKELAASIIGATKEVLPQIVACSASYAQVHSLIISQGRFINHQDMKYKNMVCVMGDSIAKSLGLAGKIGSYIRIENNLFKIVGILKRGEIKTSKSSVVSIRNYNDLVFIPIGAERALNQEIVREKRPTTTGLTEIVIQIEKSKQVLMASDIIRRIMEINHSGVEDYQMIVPQELLEQSRKIQRTFNIVLGSIAVISLLVGGIGIMNIMLATVSERTKEIGIRRAVGAAREHIMIQFLAESVILTFSGGVVGIAAGIGGVWLIATIAGWKTIITIWSIIISLLMSTFVGIFFGLYPAYQASRMDPISALRHV
jgi:putative ABC transport system permease protein